LDPPHTAQALEPNPWRGAGLAHAMELPMERGVGQVWGYSQAPAARLHVGVHPSEREGLLTEEGRF